MSVSYRLGDKVRILPWDELEEKFDMNEDGDILDSSGHVFGSDFIDYAGTIATVVELGFYFYEGTEAIKIHPDECNDASMCTWTAPCFVKPLPPKPAPKDLSLDFEDIFR